jgi:hypothetical protein
MYGGWPYLGAVAESAVTAVLSEAEVASEGTTTAVFSVVVASGLLLHEASSDKAAQAGRASHRARGA